MKTTSAGRPAIRKTGTIDCDMVETTPVVFRGRLYRFEYVRDRYYKPNKTGDSYFRLVDVDAGTQTAPFARGYHLGAAHVQGDTVYAYGVPSWGGALVQVFWSRDLARWDTQTSDGRLAPHLHMPLQSGADPVLRRMRRWHTRAEYRARALTIAERVHPLGLGADVIAGFPGETVSDHEETMDLVREPEREGLTNEELSVADRVVTARLNPAFSSGKNGASDSSAIDAM